MGQKCLEWAELARQKVCGGYSIRVGQKVPKLMQTKAGEMVSSYDYLSQLDCIRHPIGVTAFYSEALLVYVVKNSSCM